MWDGNSGGSYAYVGAGGIREFFVLSTQKIEPFESVLCGSFETSSVSRSGQHRLKFYWHLKGGKVATTILQYWENVLNIRLHYFARLFSLTYK